MAERPPCSVYVYGPIASVSSSLSSHITVTMITRKCTSSASALCSILFLLPSASGHMEMSWPYPLRSSFNPNNNYTDIDYSMTSPLNADGSNFPCKGYQNDRPIQTTISYTAGSMYNMTLAGDAMHGGGSCQLSLSYDNGATFRVIKSIIGGCPLNSTYNFSIPSYAPAGVALFAWTWQNFEGNREYYMNCAEVNVTSGSGMRRRKRDYSSFEQLPYIWKANLACINDCVTSEGENPAYPHAGPDVVYGNNMSASSPPTPGLCDAPTPYGATYKDLGDSTEPAPPSNGTRSCANPANSTQAAYTPTQTQAPLAANPYPIRTASSSRSYSTTTVTVDCPHTVTITRYPSISHRSTTHTVSPVKPTRSAAPSWTTHTWGHSTIHAKPTTPPPAPTEGQGHPPYAGGDVENYLPCVPGTFICVSSTTWDTCDYNDGSVPNEPASSYVYDYPRQVAAGMSCISFLSPYSSDNSEYAQQALTPNGYYRDDRIVRARPDGDCSSPGAILCRDSGQQFDVCDQGGWVRMGPVAAGTVCQGGQIVASS